MIRFALTTAAATALEATLYTAGGIMSPTPAFALEPACVEQGENGCARYASPDDVVDTDDTPEPSEGGDSTTGDGDSESTSEPSESGNQ
jgi:hypothetical protein